MSASAFSGWGLPSGLLLRPAGAGDEEELRVRADRLLARGRRADARDLRPRGLGRRDRDRLHGRRGAALRLTAGVRARVDEEHPRALLAAELRLDALPVVPARRGGPPSAASCVTCVSTRPPSRCATPAITRAMRERRRARPRRVAPEAFASAVAAAASVA